MTAHSSVLAWRIPWTKEPGRLAKSQTHLYIYICCSLVAKLCPSLFGIPQIVAH